jgi:hypothetical protein
MSAMDADEVRRRITEHVGAWADEDVAVRVEGTAVARGT